MKWEMRMEMGNEKWEKSNELTEKYFFNKLTINR